MAWKVFVPGAMFCVCLLGALPAALEAQDALILPEPAITAQFDPVAATETNFLLIITVAGFAFIRWSFDFSLKKWGQSWGVRGIGDVAGLPLVVLLFSIFYSFMTPVANTFIRAIEAEADLFGLNAARQPDGEAAATLKLAEYRKMSPGPIEEFIFYDHPSGRNRILMAMKWKAEHLNEPAPPTLATPAR